MYELTTKETRAVAGATLYYVTEEWKHEQAQINGYFISALCGFIGGTFGAVSTMPILGAAVGATIGMTLGYNLGYGMSRLENSDLENNAWYDISYTYYAVYF
ncbi:MAG: hypothetical protein JSR17_09275 [Proteobacteria bacterium]|nr:hypothetical protein [Pseudomonadota bacterium]